MMTLRSISTAWQRIGRVRLCEVEWPAHGHCWCEMSETSIVVDALTIACARALLLRQRKVRLPTQGLCCCDQYLPRVCQLPTQGLCCCDERWLISSINSQRKGFIIAIRQQDRYSPYIGAILLMSFHPGKPARNYVYTCSAPMLNADLAEEQLRRAAVYRNNLVELELRRRERNQRIRSEMFPALAELEQSRETADASLVAARAEMKAASAAARKRQRPAELVARIESLRAKRKAVAIALTALRETVNTDATLLAAWEQSDDEAAAEKRRLRSTCGVAWGTYLVIESGVKPIGYPPRFRRFDGTGRIAVQIQSTRPLTTEQLLTGGNTSLAYRTGNDGTHIRLRIGSEGRNPVWTEVKINRNAYRDRPLPPEKDIKWAYLIARAPGSHLPRRQWQLCFVLAETSDSKWEPKNTAPPNTHLAIDVNWRRIAGRGIRVAVWRGDDGEGGDLIIPEDIIVRELRAQEVQSERDDRFNAVRARLVEWLRSTPLPLHTWMRELLTTMPMWRSQRRLAAFVIRWRTDRIAGDETIFAEIEAWRKWDKHRYQHESKLRERVQCWRENYYRTTLKKLSCVYSTAFVEKLNVATMHRTPQPEEADLVVKRYRNLASVGRLLQLAKEYFTTIPVGASGTTTLHLACGHDNKGIDKGPMVLTCEGCGADFDQDENAAQVIMERGLAAEVVV